jgi:uncharacterized membrane protein
MGDRFGVFDEETDTETVLTKVLGVTLVVALLVVIVFAIAPIGTGDTYTEFYVLGPNGTASDYPENVTVGETATVRVGIGNSESRRQTYTLVIRTNETTFLTREITLDRADQGEEPVSFSFDSPGRKRLRLELYLGETTDGDPYRNLRLFVEVRPE